jgi:hypothetical protein
MCCRGPDGNCLGPFLFWIIFRNKNDFTPPRCLRSRIDWCSSVGLTFHQSGEHFGCRVRDVTPIRILYLNDVFSKVQAHADVKMSVLVEACKWKCDEEGKSSPQLHWNMDEEMGTHNQEVELQKCQVTKGVKTVHLTKILHRKRPINVRQHCDTTLVSAYIRHKIVYYSWKVNTIFVLVWNDVLLVAGSQ